MRNLALALQLLIALAVTGGGVGMGVVAYQSPKEAAALLGLGCVIVVFAGLSWTAYTLDEMKT